MKLHNMVLQEPCDKLRPHDKRCPQSCAFVVRWGPGVLQEAHPDFLQLPELLNEVLLNDGRVEMLRLFSVGAVDGPEHLVGNVNATVRLKGLGPVGGALESS